MKYIGDFKVTSKEFYIISPENIGKESTTESKADDKEKTIENNRKLLEKTDELAYLLDDETIFSTIIHGNLDYTSKKELDLIDGLVLSNNLTFTKYSTFSSAMKSLLSYLINLCNLLAYILIVFFIGKKFTPKFLEKATKFNPKNSLISLGIGIGLLIFVPIVFILLCLVHVGALLALLLAAIYILLLFLSIPVVLIAISKIVKTTLGDKIVKNRIRDDICEYLYLADSTIAFSLLLLIPYFNAILLTLMILLGTGTLALLLFKKREIF